MKELRRQNVICSDIVYNRVGHLLYINVLREIVLTQSGGLKEKNDGTNAASAASKFVPLPGLRQSVILS